MSKFYTFSSKKNDKEKENRFHFSAKYYLLGSSLFWSLLSLFFYFYLYDPYYANNSILKLTHSSTFFFKALAVIVLTALFSAFIGLLITIPSLLIKYFLLYRLKKREGRGQKPVILIFNLKYLPLFFLFTSHIFFILFNFSCAPDILYKAFSPRNPIVTASLKIHHFFHRFESYDYYNSGKDIGEKFSNNASYIFLIPEDAINNISYYQKTKQLLTNKSDILLTSNFLTEYISSLFDFYPSNKSMLYSPLPLTKIAETNQIKRVFIGTTNRNSYLFYNLFHPVAETQKSQLKWFDIFLNHFAFSQPQLMFFFKKNAAGLITNTWKWNVIAENPTNLMNRYANQIKSIQNQNLNTFVFDLPNTIEKNEKKLIMQVSPLKMNSEMMNSSDQILSKFIEGLLSANIKNIILLPYLSNSSQPGLYHFYTYQPKDSSKIYLSNNALNERLFDFKKTKCFLKSLPPFEKKYSEDLLNLLERDDENITLNKDLNFSIANKLRNSFACYDENNNLFFITENHEIYNPLNFNSGELFSKMFSLYTEHNSYSKKEKIAEKTSPQKANDNFVNEFFSQFIIYKVNSQSNNLKIVTGQEKDILLKSKGNIFINEMFEEYTRNKLLN